jgi:hypothetical protein
LWSGTFTSKYFSAASVWIRRALCELMRGVKGPGEAGNL